MRKTIRLLLALMILLPLSLGCIDPPPNYGGDRPDLYTVAANSLISIDMSSRFRLVILDEDGYGRTMFACRGTATLGDDSSREAGGLVSVLIAQKTDDGYVYYYPDVNYLVCKDLSADSLNKTLNKISSAEELWKKIEGAVPAKDIESLREDNDWERPLDQDRCIRVKIVRSRRGLSEDLILKARESMAESIVGLSGKESCSNTYLTSDEYDRHLYLFRAYTYDRDNRSTSYGKTYAVIFGSDGSHDKENGIMEITDPSDYRDELKAFKEKNNWGRPIK
ncbi:MAG: hypothetical protein FWE94_01130 [Coriobacteriia bacterium]|nr:hypothetical protein [Coriobacteriia bacterium]